VNVSECGIFKINKEKRDKLILLFITRILLAPQVKELILLPFEFVLIIKKEI